MALPSGLDREIGYAGPDGIGDGGWVVDGSFEDYVPDLTYPRSIMTFTRMRRDPKVAEVLGALTLPVRRARWSIDPNGARPDVVTLIATDLGLPVKGTDAAQPIGRVRDRFSWEEHLRLALLKLVYGHMPFEQLYRILPTGPGGALQARLRKLGPRFPATIADIKVARDGGLEGLVQHDAPRGPDGKPEMIGVDRLVWYAHDREGAAWQGQSVLRAAYKPWRLKDEAERTWATSLRRNGIGQPVYHGAEGEVDMSKGRDLASRARVSEVSGAAVPYGASLTFEGVRGSLPDHHEFVRTQDEHIASALGAAFLNVPGAKNGSRALGSALIDFFLLSQQTLADDLIDTATSHVVEDLVDLNFGEDEQAPRITVEDVGTDNRITAEALALLLQNGAITPDDGLEDYVRRTMYQLPARTTPRPAVPVAPAVTDAPSPAPVTAAAPTGTVVTAASRRDPSPPEASVDFDAIHNAWQSALSDVLDGWKTQRSGQMDALMGTLADLLAADDIAGLGGLTAPTGPGADLLDTAMRALADTAAAEAVAEAARQGVTIATPDLELDSLTARATAVDEILARSLADVTSRQALLRYSTGTPVADVVAAVRAHVDSLTDTFLSDQLGGALTAAQNHGRFQVMDAGPVQDVYASELLDIATCEPCGANDGTRYPTVAAGAVAYPTGGFRDCLGGPRCRGTLVAVYQSESPASVAARAMGEAVSAGMNGLRDGLIALAQRPVDVRVAAPEVHITAPDMHIPEPVVHITAPPLPLTASRTVERDDNGDISRVVDLAANGSVLASRRLHRNANGDVTRIVEE